MKIIRGKKAYWGRHTFEAKEHIDEDGKKATKIVVYRNLPRKYETEVIFKTKRQLVDISTDTNIHFGYFSGRLSGYRYEQIRMPNRKTTRKKKLTIDIFFESFKHKLV